MLALSLLAGLPAVLPAQTVKEAPYRGRKYKAPPETTKIEIAVTKKVNGKPVMNAAVVLNPIVDGKDIGTLEVKTNPDGVAMVDVIPRGATVRVQIIAPGLATFAQDYVIPEAERHIDIAMQRPQPQVSAYEQSGKALTIKPGVQEPIRPKLDTKTGRPIPIPKSNEVSAPVKPSTKSLDDLSDPDPLAPASGKPPRL
jgi:hypothetical protein